MTEVTSDTPKPGYLRTPDGRWMNPEFIADRTRRENQVVEDLIGEALQMQGLLSLFKAKCFDTIDTFRQELAARYGARVGGTRGGLTLHSFDGKSRVQVSEADSLTFGPELESAKALIDECLHDWTRGGNENLTAVVNDAFHVGEGRKIRMDRVLGLRRLKIDDDRWARAMAAINDAVKTERSKLYIRFYRRERPEDQFVLLVLDLARVS